MWQERPRRLQRREVLGAIISVVVIVAAVALVIRPGGGGSAFVAVNSGDGPAPRVGRAAPTFAVETLDGDAFILDAARGRPVWINVWASWCPPCRAEMPDIAEVLAEAGRDQIAFLAMNFGETLGEVQGYVERTGYTFEIGLDPGLEFANQYRILGLPTHIFVMPDGTLREIRVGGLTRAEMVRVVDDLLDDAAAAQATGRAVR